MEFAITKDMPFEQVLEEVNPIIWHFRCNCNDLEEDDMYQVLCIKAWESFVKWDPDRGVKFTTFLFGNLQNEIRKIHRAAVTQKRNCDMVTISFEHPLKENDDITLKDIIAGTKTTEGEFDQKEIRETIRAVLYRQSKLSKRICMRCLLGDKQKAIANDEKISQSTVSNTYRRFKEELRRTLGRLGYDF